MTHPLARRVAAIPDEAYLRGTSDERIDALPADAIALDFRGLLLGAPRRVDLDAVDALWTYLVRAGVPRDDAPFLRNATLVATDLDRGHVYADRGLRPNPTKYGEVDVEDLPLPPPAAPPPPGLAELGEGASAGGVWFDYLGGLSLPRSSGHWVLRVLSFDERSNDVLVETHARRPERAGAPEPAHPLLTASRSVETPSLRAPGAALSLGGRRSPASLVLHGALRLEVASYMVADGAVRAKLLLLAKNHSGPTQVPIAVPLPSPPQEAVVDVGFSIDVGDALPKAPTGAWQAYLVAGRYISAPLPLQF